MKKVYTLLLLLFLSISFYGQETVLFENTVNNCKDFIKEGNELYIAGESSGTLQKVNLETKEVEILYTNEDLLISSIAKDEEAIYFVSKFDNTIYKYVIGSSSQASPIYVSDNKPTALELIGRNLYISEQMSQNIISYNLDTEESTVIAEEIIDCYDMFKDGTDIYFVEKNGFKISKLNTQNNEITVYSDMIFRPTSVLKHDNYLYATLSDGLNLNKLVRINLSETPYEIEELNEGYLNAHALAVYDDKILIGERNGNRIDYIDPQNPQEINQFIPGLSQMNTILPYEGKIIYSEPNVISVFDPQDKSITSIIKGLQLSLGMWIDNNVLYYSDCKGQQMMLSKDLSNENSTSIPLFAIKEVSGVKIKDGYMFYSEIGKNFIGRRKLDDIENTEVKLAEVMWPNDIAIKDNKIYTVASIDWEDKLIVVNDIFSDNPTNEVYIDEAIDPSNCIVKGDYLFYTTNEDFNKTIIIRHNLINKEEEEIAIINHHISAMCFMDSDLIISYGFDHPKGFAKLSDIMVSTEEIKSNSRQEIYPNPATNYIQIQDIENGESVIVQDLYGKAIKQCIYSNQIDISFLKAGIYFIQTPNGTTHKLIKN